MDIEWQKLSISKKKNLFTKYIENEKKKNKENYQNEIIDNLIYSKNNFLLQTLEKDKFFLKNLKDNDIIIKNENIYQIKNIKKNNDNLIYYYKDKTKQTKLPNYRVVKNYIDYENREKDEKN